METSLIWRVAVCGTLLGLIASCLAVVPIWPQYCLLKVIWTSVVLDTLKIGGLTALEPVESTLFSLR